MKTILIDFQMLKNHYSECRFQPLWFHKDGGQWHEIRQVPWSKVVWC